MRKRIIYLSFLVFLFSCDQDEPEINRMTCIEAEYKIEFDIQLDEEVCFPDGNSMKFKNVEHHYCPCIIDCDLEGQLLIILETTNDLNEKVDKEFNAKANQIDASIFSNHEISSFSFTYGTEDEEVPTCIDDFEPEKIKLTLIISEK